nr:hypothetical protein [Tanacetum cinerariifolium]
MEYSRRSERRPGKEVVVEPDNDAKYIDVNDESSDDDFVDTGGKISYASGLRRSGRNKNKEVYDSDIAKIVASASKDSRSGRRPEKKVVVEPDNNEKYVDVNDELSDDDFVNNSYVSGLQRSGRNKIVTELEHVKTVASGSKGKGEIQGRKRSRETIMPKAAKKMASEVGFGGMVEFKVDGILSKLGLYVVDNFDEKKMEIKLSKGSIILTKDMIGDMLGIKNEGLDILEGNPNRDDEMVHNWKQQYGDAKEIKPADVKIRMRKSKEADLNFKLNFIVLFTSIIRPPTKVWTSELLSERGAIELNCGGFGHGELEKDFVDEEGDPIPDNIENISKKRKGFEKMLTIAEHMFTGNVNLIGFADKVEALNEEVELRDGDIGVNEQTPCSGKDLIKRQKNMCGMLTQKAFESIADEVEMSMGKSKSMEIDDRPSFSFSVTQNFDVIPVTKNENKVLTPMPISIYTSRVEASDVFMFHEKRVTTKSNITRSPFYSRVADVDAALSSEESKVTKYLFLTNHESE